MTLDTKKLEAVVYRFGGTPAPVPELWGPPAVSDFDNYLRSCGVKYFSGQEVASAHRKAISRALGYGDYLLTQVNWWPRAAALCKLGDALREHVGPLYCRNWWRPSDYNSRVKGAWGSDHVQALALDLDPSNRAATEKAHRWLIGLQKWDPWLGLSLGLYDRAVHVGIMTEKGVRRWGPGA